MVAKNYKSLPNYDFLRRDNQRQLTRINNIFVETELAVRGLKLIRTDIIKSKSQNVEQVSVSGTNSKGKPVQISRKIDVVKNLLDDRITSKEYVQSLVFSIALTEEYLSKTLVRVIRAYPHKLFISPKGGKTKDDQALMVDMNDVIRRSTIGEIILEKAEQRVRDAMYASPAQYHSYYSSVLGFKISDQVWLSFVELKATRDVFVHGDGKANNIYIKKAGRLARAVEGQSLPVDLAYLNQSMTCMKRIFTESYIGLREHHGNSLPLKSILEGP